MDKISGTLISIWPGEESWPNNNTMSLELKLDSFKKIHLTKTDSVCCKFVFPDNSTHFFVAVFDGIEKARRRNRYRTIRLIDCSKVVFIQGQESTTDVTKVFIEKLG